MNFKGLIAGMLSLLVTGATFAFVASAATLDSYPTFLASGGQLNAYVVVGSGGTDPAGLASDIAGAVDIAVRLSELQYTKTTVAGSTTSSVTGIEKKIDFTDNSVAVVTTGGLPSTMQTFHFTGLKQGEVTFKGTAYRYHEAVVLDQDKADLGVYHDFTYSDVNGTQKMRLSTSDPVEYRYIFDKSGIGSPTTSDILDISLAGKSFSIVLADSSGLKALTGVIGTADVTTPITYSGYGVYVTDGASGTGAWAKIQIKDSTGNVQVTDIINKDATKTYTLGSTTIKVNVIDVFASTITNTASAKLAVGSEVDKVYPKDKTVDSLYTFPGETDWYVYWNDTDVSNNITATDFVGVFYHPASVKYLKSGEKLLGPSGYFELGYTGLDGFDTVAVVTAQKVDGKTIYATSTSTSSDGTSLSGFEIAADVKGSIIDGSNGYDKGYVLFNGTAVWRGYWDSVSSKIVRLAAPTAVLTTDNVTFNVSYGGVGDTTVMVNLDISNATDAVDLIVSKTDGSDTVTWDYENTTSLTLGTSSPTWRLGTETSAQAADVTVAYGSNQNVGDFSQDVLSNTPVFIVSPSANSGAEKAVFKVPSGLVKTKVAFGKIGATTTTAGGTYYSFAGPIVSPVAKLDSSLTSTEKAAKNLIVVGGPCVNSIAADALGLTYPTCGADSTVPENAAMIKVMDDKFATGLKVVLVAGWTASDTRLASDVLQNYDQATVSSKLVGKSSVTVSGTSVATATIS